MYTSVGCAIERTDVMDVIIAKQWQTIYNPYMIHVRTYGGTVLERSNGEAGREHIVSNVSGCIGSSVHCAIIGLSVNNKGNETTLGGNI